jgi:hypothetical protein
MHKCYYYAENNTYIKYIDILFNKVLSIYSKDATKSFFSIFSDRFSSYSYTGIKFVYKKDKEEFKNLCTSYANKINSFIETYKLININDSVTYKGKIKCSIGGTIQEKNKNVFFSFKNYQDTQKELDFYLLNNYIYNKIKNLTNDCLVYCVSIDAYFLVKYEDNDYTNITKRGLIKSIKNCKIKSQGEHCVSCRNKCKPMIINGLNRLNSIL